MQQLLPVVLSWLSTTPDPDLGLLQLRRLTEGYTRSSAVARTFRETPVAAERTSRILGSSRVLGLAMHRQPDFLDVLVDADVLATEPTRAELVEDAARHARLARGRPRPSQRSTAVQAPRLLRIGARDILGFADLAAVGHELSHLADASLEAALQPLEPEVPFAVIGLGRLGGRELSYASDIDVLFVFDGSDARVFDRAEHVATQLVRAIGETTSEGQTFRIDARL